VYSANHYCIQHFAGFKELTKSIRKEKGDKQTFSSPFTPKNYVFCSIILYNETILCKNFDKKVAIFYFGFFFFKRRKKPKRVSRDHNKGNKFCILDETKHNLVN